MNIFVKHCIYNNCSFSKWNLLHVVSAGLLLMDAEFADFKSAVIWIKIKNMLISHDFVPLKLLIEKKTKKQETKKNKTGKQKNIVLLRQSNQ